MDFWGFYLFILFGLGVFFVVSFWGGSCLVGFFCCCCFGIFYCSLGTLIPETEMQELEGGQENHQDKDCGAEVTFGFHPRVGFFLPLKPF